MSKVDIFVLLIGPVLLVPLLLIFRRRKLYGQFPFFFCYILSVVIATFAQVATIAHYQLYFKMYWASEAVYAALALLALYEVFREVFLAFYDALRWFWLIFPTVAAVVLTLSIRYALLHPAPQAPQIIVVILSVGKVIRYLQAALFVLFLI